MTITARAKLAHRSQQLQKLLLDGNTVQIIAAREMLRLSLVEMHEIGYWREHPEEFKAEMQLYRASAKVMFSPLASMSAPGKRTRCIP